MNRELAEGVGELSGDDADFAINGEPMKPIQERAELALAQGLRCVQFRLPNRHPLKSQAYACALGLRYGLIGAAAAYCALDMAELKEERDLKAVFQYWPLMVSEHLRDEVIYKLPFELDYRLINSISRLSVTPFRTAIALRRQFMPLERSLEVASDEFFRDHKTEATSESRPFGRRRAATLFRAVSAESIRFAAFFFERQRAGLPEVPEIALLGE